MKRSTVSATILLFIVGVFFGCTRIEKTPVKMDIAGNSEGIKVSSGADLIDLFKKGQSSTVILTDNVHIGREILKLTEALGTMTLIGNGFTIYGEGECVVRMDNNCLLNMEDLTLTGSRDGIGIIGDGTITATNSKIDAGLNGISATGSLKINENSSISVTGRTGRGIDVKGMTIQDNAEITALGNLNGINITRDELIMHKGSKLTACAGQYNAVKCSNTLVLNDGAVFEVSNTGEYHGAELEALEVHGTVTIKASGGEKGAGLFLFELNDEIMVMGFCTPDYRIESGHGNIEFIDME